MEQKIAESSTLLACLAFTIFIGLPVALIIVRTIAGTLATHRNSVGKEK